MRFGTLVSDLFKVTQVPYFLDTSLTPLT